MLLLVAQLKHFLKDEILLAISFNRSKSISFSSLNPFEILFTNHFPALLVIHLSSQFFCFSSLTLLPIDQFVQWIQSFFCFISFRINQNQISFHQNLFPSVWRCFLQQFKQKSSNHSREENLFISLWRSKRNLSYW